MLVLMVEGKPHNGRAPCGSWYKDTIGCRNMKASESLPSSHKMDFAKGGLLLCVVRGLCSKPVIVLHH
jgi:hypothetical protein